MSVDSSDVVGDSVSGGVKGGFVESNGNTDDGDEELADEHPESSVDEERATTESLDSVEGDRGGADVDDGEDHGDEERVGDSTSRSEERSRVVEAAKRSEESESDIDHSGLEVKAYMKLTPVHCCIIWREVPRMVRRRLERASQRDPEKQAAQEANHEPVGMAAASTSALATISESSTSMSSELAG